MANMIGQEIIPTERTTPESSELQALFARMRDAGCTHVVMEVSSHAISLERIGGIRFDVAAFTNLTEDHLDFHKTMDAYCEAKAELFRRCRLAVINADDSYSERILATAACPVLTTGVHRPADLRGETWSFWRRAFALQPYPARNGRRCPFPSPESSPSTML